MCSYFILDPTRLLASIPLPVWDGDWQTERHRQRQTEKGGSIVLSLKMISVTFLNSVTLSLPPPYMIAAIFSFSHPKPSSFKSEVQPVKVGIANEPKNTLLLVSDSKNTSTSRQKWRLEQEGADE